MSSIDYDATPVLGDLGRTHLVGIGGAGMSVVAELLSASGVSVQGSDARLSPSAQALRDAGITVFVGHSAEHVAGARTLVLSSAVRPDNPELLAARASGAWIIHRSQALAAVMASRRGVAVAGAHGKTTTSAMIATALRSLGADPSFAVGSSVISDTETLRGGHLGGGDVLVAEADESDGSFLAYEPVVSVVTNIEPDHLDHYGSREAFEAAFDAFAERVRPDGALVVCADDTGSRALGDRRRDAGQRVWTYGRDEASDVRLVDVALDASGGRATVVVGPAALGGPLRAPLSLAVAGEHNLADAAAAVAACACLGHAPEDAAAALAHFRGTGRRFELRGEAGGVRVVDDYAHHPTEVRALLRAARDVAGRGRVVVLFQPHLFSRTRTFAAEFAEALASADEVVVTGVYAAREAPDPSTDARTITDRMATTAAGERAHAVEDQHEAARLAASLAVPGDLVMTVGAGDVTELGPEILAELSR